ncbi:MAG: polymer-forming cytoskeletal protein [Spirochaetaceae bacterium]|nr:polymer-forming cytoskeletal protein [Spirochaetaceae bacterium]
MRKIIFAYYGLVILFFASAAYLTAESVEFDGGSIYVNFDEDDSDLSFAKTIEDDYIAGGNNITFSGMADDLYLMGKSVDFSGESKGGMIALGDSVELSGIVAKNLHSIGSSVRITGYVAETAFVAGESIVISKDAVVDGTLFSGSNTIHIIGHLNNGLIAGAGEVLIDGPIKGDVNVRTGKLIITERGSIEGDLIYGSNVEISEREMDRVTGHITYKVDEQVDEKSFSKFCIIVSIIFFVTICVSGLLLLLLPGVKSLFSVDREPATYGKTVLWGLIPLFIFPVAVLVTIPLLPLSIALSLSAFPLMGLTTLLGLAFAGQLLFKVFKWENKSIYLQFLFAFVIFAILAFIPFVKVLVYLAVAAAGAGLLIGKVFNTEF